MRKKGLIYSGLGLFAFLFIYVSPFQSKAVNMPYFDAMVGEGHLKRTGPMVEAPSVEKASLKKKTKTVVFDGVTFSHFLSLETESGARVAIAIDAGSFLLCPGGIDKCTSKYATPTKQEGANRLIMHGTFSGRRYVVELYKDVFIYRIQDKNCLLGYPHGCLIHGFSWNDLYTNEFRH